MTDLPTIKIENFDTWVPATGVGSPCGMHRRGVMVTRGDGEVLPYGDVPDGEYVLIPRDRIIELPDERTLVWYRGRYRRAAYLVEEADDD
jgi:hypothetical protein